MKYPYHPIDPGRASSVRRTICAMLAFGQVWIGLPTPAFAAQSSPSGASAQQGTARNDPSQALAPPRVVVNRTTPRVTPPPLMPTFSRQPSDREIVEARIFGEPLSLTGRATVPDENRALANILQGYLAGANPEAVLPFWGFLKQYPDSPWQASLLLNLGLVYRRTGYFTRAVDTWESLWMLTKAHADPRAKPIADRAVGELLELHARLGRFDRLEALLTEVDGRSILGRATEQITAAREGLWLMRNHPDQAFRCGPLAIDSILAATRPDYRRDERIWRSKSTTRGTSLAQMQQLAAEFGLTMQAVHRSPGAGVMLPALVHWRAGHFAALIREEGGKYLVRDPTFGDEIWITKSALDDEATGFMLVIDQALPAGWRSVDATEATEIWGKGQASSSDPDETCAECCQIGCASGGLCAGGGPSGNGGNGGGNPPGHAMPVASAHMMLVSLNLQDTPVGYLPPRGPAIYFTVTYNHREAFQPQTFTFSHLGPKWMPNWLSYVEDDPANPSAIAALTLRGGGRERYQNFNVTTQSYAPGKRSHAVLVRTSSSPIRYERRLPDGSVEVFAQPDGAVTTPRRVFLTEFADPAGNTVTLTYDAQLRLVSLTDAIGQVTTVSYTDPDPRRITRVTDPFGRYASFVYDASGRLSQITDVIGLASSFTYDTGDFITAMTTPYGMSRFTKGENGNDRWLELTDPAGGRERLESRTATDVIPMSEPAAAVPTGAGLTFTNTWLQYRNSFFWGKRAMAVAPRNPTSAHIVHWAHAAGPLNQASGAIESERRPLENRVWYLYPGQPNSNVEGTSRRPSVVARVLDDGSSQIWRTTYNDRGHVLTETDPMGRRTSYTYDVSGIDRLERRQTTGTLNDLLRSYSNYTDHRPQVETDAAGESTTRTYNADGQVLTVTNPRNEVTTYTYDTDGYLMSVASSTASGNESYTYDAYGRRRTVTNADGDVETTDYDALDRPIRVTSPDGTYTEMIYDRLHLVQSRDRSGRWTRNTFDAMRRLIAKRDPLGRTITYQWCACGTLDSMTDARGQTTKWERDVLGRVTKEIRADGTTATLYTYETTTSRLKSITDPKLQMKTRTYNLDDRLHSITYTNAAVPTPTVTYTHDSAYPRVLTIVDGSGTTTHTYYAPGVAGAGRLATVDGPLSNDTTTYQYDELGRITAYTLGTTSVVKTYDGLGRIDTETNALGMFSYTYEGSTRRLLTVTYPNGQTTTFTYFDEQHDRRAQTMIHRRPNNAVLSRYDYTYDENGNILTRQYENDTDAPIIWGYVYDDTDQLIGAVVRNAATPSVVLKRFAYTYDAGGNRTSEQIDDIVVESTFDSMNRLLEQRPGGRLRVAGTLSEPADVVVQGIPAGLSQTIFSASVPVAQGTSVVTIVATDASGNAQTRQYEVDALGSTKQFDYDANGNMISDGVRTYEWDADDRLTTIEYGDGSTTTVAYDGRRRRVSMTESTTSTTTNMIWNSREVAEERDAAGTVTLREFSGGFQLGGVTRFVARDHLGSVVDVTDSAGDLVARMAYDPFGQSTRIFGSPSETMPSLFTGYRNHDRSGLALTLHRAYAPPLGAWLSRDPLENAEFRQGPNLYSYAWNNPVNRVDPLGLDAPRCDGVPVEFESPCVLECCAAHDECYDRKGCTSHSWTCTVPSFPTPATYKACKQCNWDAVTCVIKCGPLSTTNDPTKPDCYDAAQSKYVPCPPPNAGNDPPYCTTPAGQADPRCKVIR